VGFRNHVSDGGRRSPKGKEQFFVVIRPIERHLETAAVFASKGIIQYAVFNKSSSRLADVTLNFPAMKNPLMRYGLLSKFFYHIIIISSSSSIIIMAFIMHACFTEVVAVDSDETVSITSVVNDIRATASSRRLPVITSSVVSRYEMPTPTPSSSMNVDSGVQSSRTTSHCKPACFSLLSSSELYSVLLLNGRSDRKLICRPIDYTC